MKMEPPIYCLSSNDFTRTSLSSAGNKAFTPSPPPSSSVYTIQVLMFLMTLACQAAEPPASQWSSDNEKNATLRRHRACLENQQYNHEGLCCLNCQAGEHTQAPLRRDSKTSRRKHLAKTQKQRAESEPLVILKQPVMKISDLLSVFYQ